MAHLWEHLSEDQQVCSISCGLELPETERDTERQTETQRDDHEDEDDGGDELLELDSMMGGLGIAPVAADKDDCVASQDKRRGFHKKKNRVLLSDSESDEDTNAAEDNAPHSATPEAARGGERDTERQKGQSEAGLLTDICNAAEGSPARTNVSSVREHHSSVSFLSLSLSLSLLTTTPPIVLTATTLAATSVIATTTAVTATTMAPCHNPTHHPERVFNFSLRRPVGSGRIAITVACGTSFRVLPILPANFAAKYKSATVFCPPSQFDSQSSSFSMSTPDPAVVAFNWLS